jgi:hypothetical protein
VAGSWIMFLTVMAWRFVKAYPIVLIALVALGALYLVGVGIVALADVSGIGYGFYVLAGGAVVVAAVLLRNYRRRRRAREAELDAARAARQEAFMAPVDAYLALASRWERSEVEPEEVIAQIAAWKSARRAGQQKFKGKWEDRMRREATKAVATGECSARDRRTDEVREWSDAHGMHLSTQFDDILGQLEHSDHGSRSYTYTLEAGGAYGPS